MFFVFRLVKFFLYSVLAEFPAHSCFADVVLDFFLVFFNNFLSLAFTSGHSE